VRYHIGEGRTNDAFYAALDFEGIVKRYQQLGILSFEMECAAVFTVAKLRGLCNLYTTTFNEMGS